MIQEIRLDEILGEFQIEEQVYKIIEKLALPVIEKRLYKEPIDVFKATETINKELQLQLNKQLTYGSVFRYIMEVHRRNQYHISFRSLSFTSSDLPFSLLMFFTLNYMLCLIQ